MCTVMFDKLRERKLINELRRSCTSYGTHSFIFMNTKSRKMTLSVSFKKQWLILGIIVFYLKSFSTERRLGARFL